MTNLYTLNTLSDLFGEIEVTVPNNDLESLYPELTEGTTVKLSGQQLVDYLHVRDTSVEFSNRGRMQRHESFIEGWLNQVKELSSSDMTTLWNRLSTDHGFMQTNISQTKFLKMMEYTHKYEFDKNTVELSGEYKEIDGKDVFFTEPEEREEKKIEIFYEKNKI